MDLIMLARAFVRVTICEFVRRGVVKIPAGQGVGVIEMWMYATVSSDEDYILRCKDEGQLQAFILQTYAYLNEERTTRQVERLVLFLRNDPHEPHDTLVQHVQQCQDDACNYPHCWSSKVLLKRHTACWCGKVSDDKTHRTMFSLRNTSCIVCATAQRCVAAGDCE